MEHSITGERSWHMDNFDLSATDVQKSMRNFPGVEEDKFYTLKDIQNGDHSFDHDGRLTAGGMTETDADTSGMNDGPYTDIQSKRVKSRWKNKNQSAYRDNTVKSLQKIKDPLTGGKTRP